MPFVSVKCTNCNGDIQLDDTQKAGFCVYCGSKVIYEEAKRKIEISGRVSVEGIATIEMLLQNAEIFHQLGNYKKEEDILRQVSNNYPEDYRAWWRLGFQYFNSSYERSNNKYGELDEHRHISAEGSIVATINDSWSNVHNALILAPKEKILDLKKQAFDFYQTFIPFFEWEKVKINRTLKHFEDEKKVYKEAEKKLEIYREASNKDVKANNAAGFRKNILYLAIIIFGGITVEGYLIYFSLRNEGWTILAGLLLIAFGYIFLFQIYRIKDRKWIRPFPDAASYDDILKECQKWNKWGVYSFFLGKYNYLDHNNSISYIEGCLTTLQKQYNSLLDIISICKTQ